MGQSQTEIERKAPVEKPVAKKEEPTAPTEAEATTALKLNKTQKDFRREAAKALKKEFTFFRDAHGMPRIVRCDLITEEANCVARGYAFCSAQEELLTKRQGEKRALGRATKAFAQAASYSPTGVNTENSGQLTPSKILDVLYSMPPSELELDPNLSKLWNEKQDMNKGQYLT